MDDIKGMKKSFELAIKNQELVQGNEAQYKLIVSLKRENEELKEKIKHLEQLLLKGPHQISSEELICMEQIETLKANSAKRELTLEEIKKLDLLVKNLRLIREQSTQVIDVSTEGLSDDELLKIVSSEGQ